MNFLTEVCISTSSIDKHAYIWDIRTGTSYLSCKSTISSTQGTGLVNFKDSPFPCHLLVSQLDCPLVQLYSFQKEQPVGKYLIPEKCESICVSPNNSILVAGGQSGRIYIWSIETGELLKMFDAHTLKITALKFDVQGTLLISSSLDTRILVWEMNQLLDPYLISSSPKPVQSLLGHRLPVNSIHVGVGLNKDLRLFSGSADKTCKVWDIYNGDCLATIVFPHQLTCLIVDPSESFLIAGSDSGLLFKVDLVSFTSPITSIFDTPDNPIITASTSSIFSGHSMKINSVSLSIDSTLIVSSSDDCLAIVWDITSKQALRTFNLHKSPVTSTLILLKPPHIAVQDFPKSKLIPFAPLQRYQAVNPVALNKEISVVDIEEEIESSVILVDKIKQLEKDNAALVSFNEKMYDLIVENQLLK